MKLLEQYGYFAAEKIWDYVIKQDYDMPIYYVLGMEEKDLDHLEAIVRVVVKHLIVVSGHRHLPCGFVP